MTEERCGGVDVCEWGERARFNNILSHDSACGLLAVYGLQCFDLQPDGVAMRFCPNCSKSIRYLTDKNGGES